MTNDKKNDKYMCVYIDTYRYYTTAKIGNT